MKKEKAVKPTIYEFRDASGFDKYISQDEAKEIYIKLKQEVKDWNAQWLEQNAMWISHLDEIPEMNEHAYCAWFYNNCFGDRSDPHCTELKDVDFTTGRYKCKFEESGILSEELYPLKKNIWMGHAQMFAVMKINGKYYDFNDTQKLKERYK